MQAKSTSSILIWPEWAFLNFYFLWSFLSLFSPISNSSSREELCKWGHCLRQLMSSPSLLAFGKKCLLMLTNVAKKAPATFICQSRKTNHTIAGKNLTFVRGTFGHLSLNKKKATIIANRDYPICSRKVLMDSMPLFRYLMINLSCTAAVARASNWPSSVEAPKVAFDLFAW